MCRMLSNFTFNEESWRDDDAIYHAIANDPRTLLHRTTFTTMKGSYIVRITGTISAISSLLIIFIIYRSSQKLSVSYHRIMVGMSLFDIIGSVSMALNTIPMPKDMIYTQFEGRHIGTTRTCEIQAITIVLGSTGTLAYNVSLCVYFLHLVWKRVENGRMRKRTELILHCCCIGISAFLICFTYSMSPQLLNPTPLRPWCTVSPYPHWCARQTNCNLLRDSSEAMFQISFFIAFFLIIMIGGDIAVIVCLVVTVRSVWKEERQAEVRRKQADFSDETLTGNSPSPRLYPNASKAASIQAVAYVFALLMPHAAVGIVIASFFKPMSHGDETFYVFARPIQGFFNLVVFLGDKIYTYRLANQDVGIFKACGRILSKKIEDNYVFSHISMVEEEKNEDEVQVVVKVEEVLSCDARDNIIDEFSNDLEGFEGSSLSYPSIETSSEQSCVLSGISDRSNVSTDVAQNNSTKEKASEIDLRLKKIRSPVYYEKVREQFCCQTNEVVQMNARDAERSEENAKSRVDTEFDLYTISEENSSVAAGTLF